MGKTTDDAKNILYGFYYNPCIHESADALISLHKTRKGAEMDLCYHKNKKLNEHNQTFCFDPSFEFGVHEDWFIKEIEIKD